MQIICYPSNHPLITNPSNIRRHNTWEKDLFENGTENKITLFRAFSTFHWGIFCRAHRNFCLRFSVVLTMNKRNGKEDKKTWKSSLNETRKLMKRSKSPFLWILNGKIFSFDFALLQGWVLLNRTIYSMFASCDIHAWNIKLKEQTAMTFTQD